MKEALKNNIVLVHRIMTLFVLFILVSCETNPPNQSAGDTEFSKIIINSNVEGAKIFLNNIFTGSVTPDSLQLAPGTYNISVRKEGYFTEEKQIDYNGTLSLVIYFELNFISVPKLVLLEDFANVSCDPCVISNKIIKNIFGTFENELLVVKFSTNFPSPIDPFYLHARTMNNSRMSYYSILLAPTIIIDGIARPVPTDESGIDSAVRGRLQSESMFSINVSDSISGTNYYVSTSTELLMSDFDYSDCNLFVCIVEDEISFTAPPGSNGERDFYHVVRRMLPDANGKKLNYVDEQNISKAEFSTEINNDWNIQKISTIAFVQNTQTKEIYQCAKNK